MEAPWQRMTWTMASLALSACGRFDFDSIAPESAPSSDAGDSDTGAEGAPPDTTTGSVSMGTMTMITGLQPLPPGDLDLGVTGTPSGFSVAFVAASGSDMYGVNLGGDMTPDGRWRSTSSSNTYVGTTMSWTGSLMTTMTTSDRLTYIKQYASDLSSYTEMDSQTGLGGKPAYAAAGSKWFYAIVDSSVLHVRQIGSDGSTMGDVMNFAGGGAAGTPLGGATVGDGTYLYAVWTHAQDACVFATMDVSAGMSMSSYNNPVTCLGLRLAVEPGRAVAVFDNGNQVQAMTLTPQAGPSAPVPLAAGTAARIEHATSGGFWLAWRTDSDLRVASYAPEQALAKLVNARPSAGLQGYELVSALNHTYLFAVADLQLWWMQLD